MYKNKIFLFAEKIINFPRSLTGKGVEQTLLEIKTVLPGLKIYKYKSNKKVFDWKIPREWIIDDAYILTPSGKKICSYKKNNLHIVGYSNPVNKTMKLSSLKKKLYSLPQQPSAVPYITSYYKNNWGFCISDNQKKKLKNGNYRVVIKSQLIQGKMLYGELLIKGKSKKEIFLTTYICHPQMANNEVSGISVLTFLSKWIKSKKRMFTYRIIFIPETIGSIAYISKNLRKLKKNVVAGFVLTCVGDEKKISYIPSRNGNTICDFVIKSTLKKYNKSYKEYSWLDRGSDERQFCSPGVDLPVCSITRSKYGTFPEYHTSLDKLGKVVTSKGLSESLEIYKNCLSTFESEFNSIFCKPKYKILCEPNMGKRNLYPKVSTRSSKSKTRVMMNVLSYCDGKKSIFEISHLCNISIKRVNNEIKKLKKNNLISL